MARTHNYEAGEGDAPTTAVQEDDDEHPPRRISSAVQSAEVSVNFEVIEKYTNPNPET